jgi:signal transduction histidine kinase
MSDEDRDSSIEDLIGRTIERHREEILDSYEVSLGMSGATLTNESPSRQVRAQAAAILEEVKRRLQDRHGAGPDRDDELNAAIGRAYANQALHPSRARRAAELLCHAILSGIASRLPPHPNLGPGLVRTAVATHIVIMEGLTSAAVSYMSFLLERLHRSHADERRRVARELHDLVAHSVALALQNLELFALYRDKDAERAAAKLDGALRELHEASDIVRSLAQDLRRSGADEGLGSALRAYMSSVPQGGEIELCFRGDEAYIPAAIRDELFLVLREGMRNAGAHANAKSIRVDVDIAAHLVRASVVDDGVGFDLPAGEDGAGLASMRERVALLGGTIILSSTPGQGTAVYVEVPLGRGE